MPVQLSVCGLPIWSENCTPVTPHNETFILGLHNFAKACFPYIARCADRKPGIYDGI